MIFSYLVRCECPSCIEHLAHLFACRATFQWLLECLWLPDVSNVTSASKSIKTSVGRAERSEGEHVMLGVTAPSSIYLLFFIPAEIQKSLLLSAVRSYKCRINKILDCFSVDLLERFKNEPTTVRRTDAYCFSHLNRVVLRAEDKTAQLMGNGNITPCTGLYIFRV